MQQLLGGQRAALACVAVSLPGLAGSDNRPAPLQCGYGNCSKCPCQAFTSQSSICGTCNHPFQDHY